jgi:hypothetical protein
MLLKKQGKFYFALKITDFHAELGLSRFNSFNYFEAGMKKCKFLFTQFSKK